MSRVLINPFRFGATVGPNTTALFVVGNDASLTDGEEDIETYLNGDLGLTVTLMSDSDNPGGYDAYSVIVVSDTCAVANVAKLASTTAGLVSYLGAAGAADALNIIDSTGVVGGLNRTAMRIVTTAHPITAAYTSGADLEVFSSNSILNHIYLNEGTGQQSTRLGRNASYSTTWVFAAGEAGDLGVTTRAGRRVQMFFRDEGVANLTSDGWTLFGNSVQWARGELS